MTTSSQQLQPGTLIGDRYRIEQRIGEGGFGAVYQATQLNLGRAVALKVLHAELLEGGGLQRFQREAALVQRLEHPNIVRLLDFGRAQDGSPFLVFELLKGQTLESVIVRTHGVSAARIARISGQILKALMEAHSLGIVHRDIKPANVFVSDFQGERDFVKLLDFGIATGNDEQVLTRQGEVVGTPAYMAPEQVSGRGATSASDLYALGLLMSEALSGRPVFDGMSGVEIAHAQLSQNPVPHAAAALQSPLGQVILRATQKQPERRYASAGEMLAHLEAAMPAPRTSSPGPLAAAPMPAGLESATALQRAYAPTGLKQTPSQARSASYPGVSRVQAPARPRKAKGSAAPWVLYTVIGGGTVIATCAVILVVTLVGRTKSAAGDGFTWARGDQLNVVEASVNADSVLDFVTFIHAPELRLCGFDGATFTALWCVPVDNAPFTTNPLLLGAAGRSIVYTDAAAVAHVLDAADGEAEGTLQLPSRVNHLCSPSEAPGKLWLKTQDKHGLMLDPVSRTTEPASRPASCTTTGKQESDCGSVDSFSTTCLAPVDAPSSLAMFTNHVLSEGTIGVATGWKSTDSTASMIMGFNVARSEDLPLWQHSIPARDGLEGVRGAHSEDARLSAGRVVAGYDDVRGAPHFVAFDAASGRTQWETKSEPCLGLVLTPNRVYLARFNRLDVLDAATGKLLGGVGTALVLPPH